ISRVHWRRKTRDGRRQTTVELGLGQDEFDHGAHLQRPSGTLAFPIEERECDRHRLHMAAGVSHAPKEIGALEAHRVFERSEPCAPGSGTSPVTSPWPRLHSNPPGAHSCRVESQEIQAGLAAGEAMPLLVGIFAYCAAPMPGSF